MSERFLTPSEAARRLSISVKALRLYEKLGLIEPSRNAAGWRSYGGAAMTRGAEITALRALGMSLAQVRQVLCGENDGLEPALAAHQQALEQRIRRLADSVETVHRLRVELAQGRTPTVAELARIARPPCEAAVVFELPWPWGGETFELRDIAPLNYIVGPLGSGKTRLARAIAEHAAGATFVGLERLVGAEAKARARLDADPALGARVAKTLARLAEDGARESRALEAVVIALEAAGTSCLVVDMIEQGLDQDTQQALIAYLRLRPSDAAPLFLMTRSTAILDLTLVGRDEAIIFCPANHSPPTRVAAYPGSPGYESVASCLASPAVRARTAGMVAARG